MAEESKDLKKIQCPACSGNLVKSSKYDSEEEENIPFAKCLGCGKEYDTTTTEYYEIFADTFITDKDSTVFSLGLKGTLRGVEYEIIGRVRYQDEDEYEKSTWDEWFAVNAEGGYHYFVEEDGEVYSYEEYIPESIDIESDASAVMFEGQRVSKKEQYVGRIVYTEGELSWTPEIGEPVNILDFKKGGKSYTLEISDDEVSITKGEKIPYKEIIDAFRADEFKDKFDATMHKRKIYGRKGKIYIAAALLSFFAGVIGCLDEKPVEGVMTNRFSLSKNVLMTENNETAYMSQNLYGPFKIEEADKLYDVTVGVNEAVQPLNQEWQSFRFFLVKEDRIKSMISDKLTPEELKDLFDEIDALPEPVESYIVSGDFWDERGSDSDGPWHENDLSSTASFILDESGQYYGYLELFSNNQRNPDAAAVSISRVKSYRYFLIAAGVFILLFIINKSKAASYNELPFHVA